MSVVAGPSLIHAKKNGECGCSVDFELGIQSQRSISGNEEQRLGNYGTGLVTHQHIVCGNAAEVDELVHRSQPLVVYSQCQLLTELSLEQVET